MECKHISGKLVAVLDSPFPSAAKGLGSISKRAVYPLLALIENTSNIDIANALLCFCASQLVANFGERGRRVYHRFRSSFKCPGENGGSYVNKKRALEHSRTRTTLGLAGVCLLIFVCTEFLHPRSSTSVCLQKLNEHAAALFETGEENEVNAGLSIMNELVVACIPLLLVDEMEEKDMVAVEDMRNRWCSYLGQEMERKFTSHFEFRKKKTVT